MTVSNISESNNPESNTSESTRRDPVRIAVVLSGWPRVSETFALNELLALRRAGMLGPVVALKAGEQGPPHPAVTQLAPLVEVLPPGKLAVQGAALAERLAGTDVAAVHGYFAHDPATVAATAAKFVGLPYGFSVHALDVRKVARAELARRAREAAVVISCNRQTSTEVAAAGATSRLVPHGVDLAAFPASVPPDADPVQLLAVGRLVEKKGFEVLLEALGQLDRPFQLRLVGDGVLRERLAAQIGTLGLSDRVQLLGRETHATLPALYAGSDVVVVPSVVDRTGDRDGLPNVVLEAMASGRAVIASDVAAISSAVQDGETGMLVPPADSAALAAAIAKQVDNPDLRSAMGRAGRRLVEQDFDLADRTAEFCRTLEQAYA